MNTIQALQTLIKGIQIAQSKGAFSLEDSATLLQAIKTLTTEKVAPKEEKQDATIKGKK